jgi:hypothetical protein
MGEWLQRQLDSMSRDYLDERCTFMYVLVQREPTDGDGFGVGEDRPVFEFGFGSHPAAPEEWSERPLREIIAFGIGDFLG